MAPVCADPRQIVITLEPARRQALLKLVDDIISHMLAELDDSAENLGPVAVAESEAPTPKDNSPAPTPGPDSEGKSPSPPPPAEGLPAPPVEKAGTGPKKLIKKPPKPTKSATEIHKAALQHVEDWKDEFAPKLMEIVCVQDDEKILGERRKRHDAVSKKRNSQLGEPDELVNFGDAKTETEEDISSLRALYHPMDTQLTSVPVEDRKEALSCILLLLLSTGKYSAHSRTLSLYLASALELPRAFLAKEETEIAKSLMESSKADESQKQAMSAEEETAKRQQQNKFSRFWKVGLASVAGAAVIGVTGGLAAPLVAGALGGILGGVGLGGVASFLGVFWMNGALVGALFGAYGAKMTGELMDQYAKEVEDFKFIPLSLEKALTDPDRFSKKRKKEQQEERRLRVTIGVNGWLRSEEDVTKPWLVLGTDSEVFALRYEMKTLLQLGSAFYDLVSSFAWKTFKMEIIKRSVLATLWAALWPITVLAAASNVDNPFSRASNRSRKAGRLLADALINRVQGERPVTLVGYSLGAVAIHACLQSLAERQAFGLVDTVVIMGTPAPADPAHWRTLRSAVSGKIFNVFSENDMILGFVYRMHSLSLGVAGLQAIKGVHGVENLDLSQSVSGHMRYPDLVGEILRRCGFSDVEAGGMIEKDDVILMKEEHAQGNLIDLDEVAGKDDGHHQAAEKATSDLQGLKISDSDERQAEEKPPALPRRPTERAEEEKKEEAAAAADKNPPLPRRPTADQEDEEAAPALPRRPTAEARQRPRRRSPSPEFQGIQMISNDTDTE